VIQVADCEKSPTHFHVMKEIVHLTLTPRNGIKKEKMVFECEHCGFSVTQELTYTVPYNEDEIWIDPRD
jgi:hypothetical protein